MDRVATQAGAYERARAALSTLSPRERDVVLAIARGQHQRRHRRRPRMSLATVKAHVSHILTKLDLTTAPRSRCSPTTPA